MKTDQVNTSGIQRDNETPVPQKPSFLYIFSISLGILTIIVLTASAYYGMAR